MLRCGGARGRSSISVSAVVLLVLQSRRRLIVVATVSLRGRRRFRSRVGALRVDASTEGGHHKWLRIGIDPVALRRRCCGTRRRSALHTDTRCGEAPGDDSHSRHFGARRGRVLQHLGFIAGAARGIRHLLVRIHRGHRVRGGNRRLSLHNLRLHLDAALRVLLSLILGLVLLLGIHAQALRPVLAHRGRVLGDYIDIVAIKVDRNRNSRHVLFSECLQYPGITGWVTNWCRATGILNI